MKTDEMYDFMVRAVFEETQQIKMELGEEENQPASHPPPSLPRPSESLGASP